MRSRGSIRQTFGHALAGLAELWRTERNARLHAIAATLVVAAGAWFRIERWEWAAVVAACAAVPSAEALNTAVETLCDRVTAEDDLQIKRCKDVAAGGVLLASVGAAAVGLIVFVPRAWAIVGG